MVNPVNTLLRREKQDQPQIVEVKAESFAKTVDNDDQDVLLVFYVSKLQQLQANEPQRTPSFVRELGRKSEKLLENMKVANYTKVADNFAGYSERRFSRRGCQIGSDCADTIDQGIERRSQRALAIALEGI